MQKEIAIIGISLQLPKACNLEKFWALEYENDLKFDSLSERREKDVFDKFERFDIAKGTYFENIDLFDNEYFNITTAEAERIDPQQRLMLENAVKTIHNSGYSENELQGKNVGVFHTLYEPFYKLFFDDDTSSVPGFIGTRIARYMDWRGPVLGVDTACSSSATAVHLACNSLLLGDCEIAYVGGATLGFVSEKSNIKNPLASKKDKCLPFDADADGTIVGEGVCGIILKNLKDAEKDNDTIYATIIGGSLKNGGALFQHISAPSSIAQQDVISNAWENSGINPADVNYIEAYGAGSLLGDPIEFEGISLAFKKHTDDNRKICSISSAKGQFGHLGSVSGLLGLIRLVMALKNKKLLPISGFTKLNNYIDEENSNIKVQKHLENWETNSKRVGGVSSFGLTGTNVHLVLEEYENFKVKDKSISDTYALKLSGSSLEKIEETKCYIKNYINADKNLDLGQLCYLVNKIIKDNNYRTLVVFNDKEELFKKMDALKINSISKEFEKKVFLFLPDLIPQKKMNTFINNSKTASSLYEELIKRLGINKVEKGSELNSFLLQYCALKSLLSNGLPVDFIIGSGYGKLINKMLNNEVIEDFENEFNSIINNHIIDESKFINILNSLDPFSEYLFFITEEGHVASIIEKWLNTSNHKVRAVFCNQEHDIFYQIISGYYDNGCKINFNAVFKKEPSLINLDLPIFNSRRFWPEIKNQIKSNPIEEGKSAQEQLKI